jgi:hypothetical protein
MKGLSEEIELSIQNALLGMELNVDLSKVDDDKLSALVSSKYLYVNPFTLIKLFFLLIFFLQQDIIFSSLII